MTGGRAVRPTVDDLRTADAVNLGPARPGLDERTRARLAERDAYSAEVVQSAAGFPTYEVPGFVAERFPEFRPEDPSTWPEPDRCTDGRPWGFSAYEYGRINHEDRWRRYLAAVDRAAASPAPSRFRHRDLGCRNRWKREDSRLCGTHDRPWRESVESARKRLRRNARELENLDLARRLAAHGIEADGFPDAVRLQADAVRGLLAILDEAVRRAGGTITGASQLAEFPTTDLTIPPPL